jgi:hypothetical protein
MAGVASPMLRRTPSGGRRFLLGLLVGGIAAGILLSVPVYLIGIAIDSVVPIKERLMILAAILVILATADLIRRTPHVLRQVPERFIWDLPPGFLGIVWGFDLGLLITTRKTTSLIWVAVVGVVLFWPAMAAVVLVSITVVATLAIAAWSFTDRNRNSLGIEHQRLPGLAQQGSGILILALLMTTVLQIWHT